MIGTLCMSLIDPAMTITGLLLMAGIAEQWMDVPYGKVLSTMGCFGIVGIFFIFVSWCVALNYGVEVL